MWAAAIFIYKMNAHCTSLLSTNLVEVGFLSWLTILFQALPAVCEGIVAVNHVFSCSKRQS